VFENKIQLAPKNTTLKKGPETKRVDNVLAPLLQIISVDGNYVDIVTRTYITPHYVPVLKKTFSSVEINIRDDRNRPIQFM